MVPTIGRTLKRRFAVPYGCYKLVTGRQSMLRQSGWFQSVRASKPESVDGQPVPWMNYSIVEFLSERLDSQMTLFEYGSGGSTRYFAQRVRQVTSVEYDKSWYDTVAEDLPSNARLIYHPFDNTARYAETIQRQDTRFDVVVVDGQDRVRCVEQSLPCLTEAGIVLLDDSDRECYRPAFKLLSQRGFRALRIAGLKPASCCRHESTVFYRPENCVGL